MARTRIVPPPLADSLAARALGRLRSQWAVARHPALRGTQLHLAPGTQMLISPSARIQIGPGFVARRDLTLSVQGELQIGRGMFCNRGVMLAAMHRVTIGDDVRLGERVSIIDHNHVIEPLDDLDARFSDYEAAPVAIGDRVLISANCVVLAGAFIGADSVIAAGSVVRGEIPAGVLAAGAPASVKRALTASERATPARG
jgi:acetyltransferase-like isoleucine patch superfamily enzyme